MEGSEKTERTDGMSKFLLVPSDLLVFIRKQLNTTYISAIYKETKMTWSWINEVIIKFEKYGLIEREKQGRIKIIKLTKKGEELADDLIRIESILKKIEKNLRQESNKLLATTG